MNVKKIIQKDRSAVNTIAVIAIVIILVIAAGAAYILLTGEDKETEAPGTMFKYEIYEKKTSDGKEVLLETEEQKLLGQNADSFFIAVTESDGKVSTLMYILDSKSAPDDLKQIDTTEIETKYGLKAVDILTYTQSGILVTSYVDSENGLGYLHEIPTTDGLIIKKLIDYNLEWQKSYKESKSIGKTYEYAMEVAPGLSYKAQIECVADCLDDKLGVMYDFSSFNGGELYFLSANIQGLPTDATNTGATATLSTIDGNVTVQVWGLTIAEGLSMTFFYDSESKIVYKFVVITPTGELPFDLTKKSK